MPFLFWHVICFIVAGDEETFFLKKLFFLFNRIKKFISLLRINN